MVQVMNPWTKFVDNIAAKLAFFPPSPPSYAIREHDDGTGEFYVQPLERGLRKVSSEVAWVKVERPGGRAPTSQVATALVKCRQRSRDNDRPTILFSHGNAVDLGQMMPIFSDLANHLNVDIMGYDYSGYGCSKGLPSTQNTLSDIQAVFDHLVHYHNIPPSRIVLYGQSIGSGPSTWLASRVPDLAGLVLHSGLVSGVRVLNPNMRWWPGWADIYPNFNLLPLVKAPVLVMHGTQDEVIHISHGYRLYELAPNKTEPLWAEGRNHQDLELHPLYLPRLMSFLEEVKEQMHRHDVNNGQ